nr:putative RNA-binding protein Luc7-like 1 isoform X4 [Manis javanica]
MVCIYLFYCISTSVEHPGLARPTKIRTGAVPRPQQRARALQPRPLPETTPSGRPSTGATHFLPASPATGRSQVSSKLTRPTFVAAVLAAEPRGAVAADPAAPAGHHVRPGADAGPAGPAHGHGPGWFSVSLPAYINLQGSCRKASCSSSRDETRQRVKFTDDRVCKSHLLDCCPHDILAGTRMDLGECTKIHDLALRADYEIASKERDLFFELDMPSITVLCFQARYPGLKPLCDLGQVIHSSYPSVSRAGDERIKCRDFGAKSQGSCCCPLPLWKWHLSFFIWETDHRRLRCCSHYCPGLLLSGCSADLMGLLQALQRVCCCGQAELGQPQPGCLPCASTLRSHSQWVMSPRDPDVEVGRLSSKW